MTIRMFDITDSVTVERCGHGWQLKSGQTCPMCRFLATNSHGHNLYKNQGLVALRLALDLILATESQRVTLLTMGERLGYYRAINAAREMQKGLDGI